MHTSPNEQYRHMTATELCTACRAPATTACPRCAAPVCAAHAPDRRRRCTGCESEFERRKPDEDSLLNALTFGWIGLMVFLVGAGYTNYVWWLGAPLMMAASWLTLRIARGRFLLQRKRPVAQLLDANPSTLAKDPDATDR